MRKLRIAQVAPLWYSVPPRKYGGIERIIFNLTEGLLRKGHKVTLFATGDSKTNARLVSVINRGIIDQGGNFRNFWWNPFNHSVVFENADQFDIIHCHWGIMGAYFQRFVKTPVLHTLHNFPLKSDPSWKIFAYYKNDLNLVFISRSQERRTLLKFKNSWIIHNGVDISKLKFSSQPKDYFVWIGRVDPSKGIENAIKIAKKAKVKLLLAGEVQAHLKPYFETKIKPELNSQIQYVGELSQEELSDFYGGARALLYPIEWKEPFGLVMIEAQACGCPVIAPRRASVLEIIEDGKTGFTVSPDPKQMVLEIVKAIKTVDQIDRLECRKHVERNFTVEKMVDQYEKIYYKILNLK